MVATTVRPSRITKESPVSSDVLTSAGVGWVHKPPVLLVFFDLPCTASRCAVAYVLYINPDPRTSSNSAPMTGFISGHPTV